MTEPPEGISFVWSLLAAGVLLAFDLVLSVALTATSALSRVALHAMGSESDGRLAFLGEVQEPDSPHRLAAVVLRQICLLASMALLVVSAGDAGLRQPLIVALAVAGLLGVVAVESMLARGIALWSPRRVLPPSAQVIRFSYLLLFPIVRPLHHLLDRVGNGHHRTEEQREEDQEHEVEALIEVGEREGLLEAAEGKMMRGIVDLDETMVREIMTVEPR